MQLIYSSSLAHHGIKGMRWGIRRYQNADGSLTAAGKKRLAKSIVSFGDKNSHSYKIADDVEKKLKLKSHIIISESEKADIQKAGDDWYEKNEALIDLWDKIAVEKKDEIDKAMKRDGVDPDDRHRGYWEEEYVMKDDRYRKAEKEEKNALKHLRSLESKVVNKLIGEYGNEKIENCDYYKNDVTVRSIIEKALFQTIDEQ